MYYVNNNMYYIEGIAEFERFDRRLNVTGTDIKDTGMLQAEHHKPLKVPSVAARLLGY